MSNDLIINVSSQNVKIAFLQNQKLIELTKEESNLQFAVGDIYLAKVKRIIPGLNASFVNIGHERDAFLHYLDLGSQFKTQQKYLRNAMNTRFNKKLCLSDIKLEKDIEKHGKIANLLKAGHSILAQITKEPISTKGPRLSSEISIPGRNLVLMPFSDKVSISQKITSAEERNRLKRLIHSIKPKNYGVIIRTAAEKKKVAVLDQELKALASKWKLAISELHEKKPPLLLLSEINRTSAMLRDILNASFENIYVNDSSVYKDIKEYVAEIAPDKTGIVKYVRSQVDIFDKFGINKQIKQIFGKTVTFKNGAYLIIEHPEAFHAIDVNSGNSLKSDSQEENALNTNLAACEEIARQLRLRDMGGIIVVDFIDMKKAEHRKQVYLKMKKVMENDRAKHQILTLSRFGLMQITRQRVRPEMNIEVQEGCPTCNGTGKVAPTILLTDRIEKNIHTLVNEKGLKKIKIKMHPFVASYITKGILNMRRGWQSKYKIKIKIESAPSFELLSYNFFDENDELINI